MAATWNPLHIIGVSLFSMSESWQGFCWLIQHLKTQQSSLSASLLIFLKSHGLQSSWALTRERQLTEPFCVCPHKSSAANSADHYRFVVKVVVVVLEVYQLTFLYIQTILTFLCYCIIYFKGPIFFFIGRWVDSDSTLLQMQLCFVSLEKESFSQFQSCS